MVINMEEKIYKQLIKLINKASKVDEVPVAAIITYENKIIAKAYNKREKNNDVLGHAEIKCIEKASKKLKTWKLDKCILFVTLKPCSMCEKIINESRIKKVIYILDKTENKKEYYKTKYVKLNDLNKENNIKKIMNNFFIKKRK